MPDENNFVAGPVQGFTMSVGKCQFTAWLPERKTGGFDLYLDREASELECLEVDQITWLRHQAAGDNVVFVSHLSESTLDRRAKATAQERFGQWLQQHLGLAWTPGTRAEWEEIDSFF